MKQFKFFEQVKEEESEPVVVPTDVEVNQDVNRNLEDMTFRLVSNNQIPSEIYDHSERIRDSIILAECKRLIVEIYQQGYIHVVTNYDRDTEMMETRLHLRVQTPI